MSDAERATILLDAEELRRDLLSLADVVRDAIARAHVIARAPRERVGAGPASRPSTRS